MTMLLFFTLLSSLTAKADVNMKDASYYKTWIDLEITKGPQVFQLRRTYQSRSLHQGLFGFGWCSDLEKNLDLSRSDQIQVRDCRLNAPIKFKKLKPNLYESPDHETLEYKDQKYIRITSKKILQIYNNSGQLISLGDTTGNQLDITYNSAGILQSLRYQNSPPLRVKMDSAQKRVLSVSSAFGPRAVYRYQGGNLVQVLNSWQHQFDYEYDEFHNLTRITYPDKTQEKISYDNAKDWVVKVQNRQGCEEIFKYLAKTTALLTGADYTATAEKRCGGKTLLKTVYEFRHKARADGTTYLDQVHMTQGKKIQRRISYQTQGPSYEIP